MGSALVRLLLLALFAVAVVGCGAPGSAEAGGDTASLSQEIPKPKSDVPDIVPQGHSLLKEKPGDMSKSTPKKGQ